MIPNRSAPTAAIVPILVYEDVGEALEYLSRVFGFEERLRAEWQNIRDVDPEWGALVSK